MLCDIKNFYEDNNHHKHFRNHFPEINESRGKKEICLASGREKWWAVKITVEIPPDLKKKKKLGNLPWMFAEVN